MNEYTEIEMKKINKLVEIVNLMMEFATEKRAQGVEG